MAKDFDGQLTPTTNSTSKMGQLVQESRGMKDILANINTKMDRLSKSKPERTQEKQTKELKKPLEETSLKISELTDKFSVMAIVLRTVGKFAFKMLTKKKTPTNPKKKHVAKADDPGSLYVANTIRDVFGKGKGGEDGEEGGGLSGLFGGAGMGLGSILMKALPIAGIIASLGMMIWDGIKAIDLAGEWGTGKVEAFIGGFFGGTEKGWKGAFKNMGKWALMGVSSGFLAGGPVGALAGGLIGAAIGGVFGFIGGEEIAKGLETTKQDMKKIWQNEEANTSTKVIETYQRAGTAYRDGLFRMVATPYEMIATLFTSKEEAKGIRVKIEEILREYSPLGMIFKRVQSTMESLKDVFGKDRTFKERLFGVLNVSFLGVIKDIFTSDLMKTILGKIKQGISFVVGRAISNIRSTGMKIKEILGPIVTTIFSAIGSAFSAVADVTAPIRESFMGFIGTIFDKIKAGIETATGIKDKIGSILKEKIGEPISNLFTTITDFFAYLGSFFSRGLSGIKDLASTIGGGGDGGGFSEFREERQRQREVAQTRKEVNSFSTRPVMDAGSSDDAIVTDGKILRVDPSDSIIATKNPAYMSQGGGNDTGVNQQILTALNTLIEATRANKPESNELNNLRQLRAEG